MKISISLTAALALMCGVAFYLYAQVANGVPTFSIQFVNRLESRTDPARNRHTVGSLERNSKGETVERRDGANIIVSSVDSGATVEYSPVLRKKTTLKVMPEGVSKWKAVRAQTSCDYISNLAYIGADTFLNIPVMKYRVDRTAASNLSKPTDDRHETIVWMAPSLGCQFLKDQTTTSNSRSEVVSVFTREATSVRLGEPEEAHFMVPANFQEVLPSELAEEGFLLSTQGKADNVPVCIKNAADAMDESYRKANAVVR